MCKNVMVKHDHMACQHHHDDDCSAMRDTPNAAMMFQSKGQSNVTAQASTPVRPNHGRVEKPNQNAYNPPEKNSYFFDSFNFLTF